MSIIIRKMTNHDIPSWIEMRAQLWPHCPLQKHKQEILDQLDSPQSLQGFIVLVDQQPAGFIEAAIHQNAHKKYGLAGYIEGWFMKDTYRLSGYGKMLVHAVEKWSFEKGCKQIASDTEDFNFGSIVAHKKLGFIEQFRADGEVKFLKLF